MPIADITYHSTDNVPAYVSGRAIGAMPRQIGQEALDYTGGPKKGAVQNKPVIARVAAIDAACRVQVLASGDVSAGDSMYVFAGTVSEPLYLRDGECVGVIAHV